LTEIGATERHDLVAQGLLAYKDLHTPYLLKAQNQHHVLERDCARSEVRLLTPQPSRKSMSRSLSITRKSTASRTLGALSVCGIIAVAFTTKPAQPLQQNSTSLTPHTKSAQIDPRSIGLVLLAA
jgi:hypothetical protein